MPSPFFPAVASLVLFAGALVAPATRADPTQDIQRLLRQGQMKEAREHSEQALARASPLQDAQRLFGQGQFKEALERTEQIIAASPTDARPRFLKGLILMQLNRTADAVAVFVSLREDYPQLPEPHRYLALLYSQQREPDKAKQALDTAARTEAARRGGKPDVTGIYARAGSPEYDKALLPVVTVPPQGTLIGALGRISERFAAAPTAVAAVAESSAPPKTAGEAVRVPESRPQGAAKPAPAHDPGAMDTTPRTPPKGDVKAEATPSTDALIGRMVQEWAADWSRKDVNAYLAHYAKEFRTPAGQTRSAWESLRSRRITKPGPIQVSVDKVQVSMDGSERAAVTFRQHYRSAGFKASGNKLLVLIKRDGRWLIEEERAGS